MTTVSPSAQEAVEIPLPTPVSFPFPYPQPYDIQLDLMRTVFEAIEQKKIAIVESPTGTGKSLTLLTSTLSWLQGNKKRLDAKSEAALRARLQADDPDDPAWVIEHALKAQLGALRATAEAREARLALAREKEAQRRRAAGAGANTAFRVGGKRARIGVEVEAPGSSIGDRGDEEFLPDDGGVVSGSEGGYLSKEVLELMAKYEATKPKASNDEEGEEEDVPKIYYTSRTHTQLRQLTTELMKTSFPSPLPDDLTTHQSGDLSSSRGGISMVPLGSRKQLCINAKVRSAAKTDERLNEACLDMQKSSSSSTTGSGGGRCEYLPPKEEEHRMLDMRDAVLATVRDIEDVVQLGKRECVCPYYATRRAVKQAELVTLPYNLLLQKNAREALDIDLTNQVVVIDEAHNLIDTLLSIYSTTLTSTHLASAQAQLQQYLARFKNRLKSNHALRIRQTLSVISGLLKVCERFLGDCESKTCPGTGTKGEKGSSTSTTEMLDANELMARVGGGSDQVNLGEMVGYLQESKLARKVSGFAEKQEEVAAKGTKTPRTTAAKHASITSFHLVESFLLSLLDARDDGRILLSVESQPPTHAQAPSGSGSGSVVTIRYMLLNPAERFREVIQQARSVILAGGTMEPISDFFRQLFPFVPKEKISTLSCKHVIPKSNLLTQVVSVGPRKVEFEFKYSNRGDDALLTELGAVLLGMVGLIPDGMVVFLPSYAFLEKVKAFWAKSGLIDKLSGRKEIFYEPQTSGDVEVILRDYALAISTAQIGEKSKKNGALLFAVVGGKLSEGINFSDSLGRCVIMVGLPFANVGSVELQERMRYVEKLPGAGRDAAREMYENLCMRAVNQSIGRAIRHANDYASILLVDKRYATPRIRTKLPKWIGEDVVVGEDYAGVARGVAAFFREKRRVEALHHAVP